MRVLIGLDPLPNVAILDDISIYLANRQRGEQLAAQLSPFCKSPHLSRLPCSRLPAE